MKTRSRSGKSRYGGVLISALAFVTITSLMVAGIVTLAVSHYAREQTEADYVTALALAEAGVNYEFQRISLNPANGDQSPGTPHSIPGRPGTFTVYCANNNSDHTITTPWVLPGDLYVFCTGTINGVSRSLRVSGKGYSTQPSFAMFGINGGLLNGTPSVNGGDVGTNGAFSFNGSPSIVNGSVVLAGGSATLSQNGTSFVPKPLASPVIWPTVSTIANQTVAGGLTTLATVNDNALATPPIVGNAVFINGSGTLTLHGKPGGANYYLTSMLLNGTPTVIFDNSAGPINIWQGPNGGAGGTFILNGGGALISNAVDPTKKVSIYIATNNAVTLNGGPHLDAGIYDYNGPSSGTVTINGSGIINGSIITNRFTNNGNPQVNFQTGYFQTTVSGYYGFDDQWLEVGGM